MIKKLEPRFGQYIQENHPNAILIKIKDTKFEGNHPNGFNEGICSIGIVARKPIVGSSCVVGRVYTSTVTRIIEEGPKEVLFETLNSVYKLEYE